MADRIKKEDILEKGISESFDELNDKIQTSIKRITELVNAAAGLKESFNPKTINDVTTSQQKYNEVSEKSRTATKEVTSAADKYRKKIEQLNEEEERAKIALSEKRKQIRNQIKAEKDQQRQTGNLTRELRRQIKTEKQATEQNKKLLAMRKQVDASTKKGAKEISLINKQIDKNNKLLTSNASTLGKQKMNVGNYKDSVSEALEEQELFGISLNKISSGLKSGAGIIGAVSAVMFGLGKAYASSARGAEDMARAADRLNIITKSLGNSLADATGEFNLFDSMVKFAQFKLQGYAKTMETEVQVQILSTIRNLDTLNAKLETVKKSQLNKAEELRQVRDDERNSFEERMAANEELGKVITEREEQTIKFQEFKLEGYKKLLKFDEGNIELQRTIAQLEFEIADAREEAQGFRSEMLTNEMALSREYAANEIELQKLILQGKIAAAETGSTEELMLKRELINKIKELELQAAGENEQLQQIAIQKAKNASDQLVEIKREELEQLNELKAEQIEIDVEIQEERMDVLFESEMEKYWEQEEIRQEARQAEIDAEKAKNEAKKQSVRDYVSFAATQAQGLTSSIMGYLNQELDTQQQMDIERAKSRGASEAEITAIEKEYAKKRQNMKVTEAIINGALGVVNMLATVSFPLNIIMAALVAVMTGIEVATIKSQKYAKGIKDSGSDGQMAWVGEQGTEIVRHKDGSQYLTPNKPTYTYLPPHSEVVPNHRLQQELASLQQGREQTEQRNDNKELIKALKKRDETFINITENGVSVTAKKGNDFYKYIDRKYRR